MSAFESCTMNLTEIEMHSFVEGNMMSFSITFENLQKNEPMMTGIELVLLKWQQFQNLVHRFFKRTLVNIN